jgi:hypothetical protein
VFHHLLVRRTVGLLGDEAPRAYLVMQARTHETFSASVWE